MKKLLAITALLVLPACAITELTPAAQNVKTISAEQAKRCTFIDSFSTNNQNTLSKDPEADARAKAFNRTAAAGGNAFLIKNTQTQVSSSGIGSTFILTGEAYRCP